MREEFPVAPKRMSLADLCAPGLEVESSMQQGSLSRSHLVRLLTVCLPAGFPDCRRGRPSVNGTVAMPFSPPLVPLARSTLIKMGVRIAVIIALTTLFSYLHMFHTLRDRGARAAGAATSRSAASGSRPSSCWPRTTTPPQEGPGGADPHPGAGGRERPLRPPVRAAARRHGPQPPRGLRWHERCRASSFPGA